MRCILQEASVKGLTHLCCVCLSHTLVVASTPRANRVGGGAPSALSLFLAAPQCCSWTRTGRVGEPQAAPQPSTGSTSRPRPHPRGSGITSSYVCRTPTRLGFKPRPLPRGCGITSSHVFRTPTRLSFKPRPLPRGCGITSSHVCRTLE